MWLHSLLSDAGCGVWGILVVRCEHPVKLVYSATVRRLPCA
jgi:hypothetical protein